MAEALELAGSILMFGGGALLSCDALWAYRNARSQRGGGKLAAALYRAGKGGLVKMNAEDTLVCGDDMPVAAARDGQLRTVAGFSLTTLGFLADLAAKLMRT